MKKNLQTRMCKLCIQKKSKQLCKLYNIIYLIYEKKYLTFTHNIIILTIIKKCKITFFFSFNLELNYLNQSKDIYKEIL